MGQNVGNIKGLGRTFPAPFLSISRLCNEISILPHMRGDVGTLIALSSHVNKAHLSFANADHTDAFDHNDAHTIMVISIHDVRKNNGNYS